MSIPISRIEATAVARFLSATFSHIDGKRLPHLSCLHLLAQAYGYRNWNAINPVIPVHPDMTKLHYGFGIGEMGFRRFAIARITTRGEQPTFVAISRDTSAPTIQELAAELASIVGRAASFRGVAFDYTRPDPPLAPPAGDGRSAATTPVVATSVDGDVTIMLWWISVLFGKPYYSHATPEVRVRQTSFENWAGYGARTPTDCFLEELTGISRPVRRCLYVPIQPSEPWVRKHEAYYPRVVLEGASDGEEAGWTCGLDRMQAVRRAYLQNREAGLSKLDIGDIVDRYRANEPDPNEEPEAEIYWMSDSYD